MERESMEYDIVIVGGGPAGLSAAIKLKQLALEKKQDVSVCVLEKGAEIGAHILSGAVLDPCALNELLPNWQSDNCPVTLPAKQDKFYFLSPKHALRLPTPPTMKNDGNFIISLSQLCRYLGKKAEDLGVEIYPGFPASDIVYNNDGTVIGVCTGDMGVDKDKQHSHNFQAGMHLLAKQTLFAEGARGSLTERIIKRFNLRKNSSPQTYALGVKEIWQVEKSTPGTIIHTVGWPLDITTYGGSFIYHLEDNKLALGFVVGLDYENPSLSPFGELQRFKTHPFISKVFENGKRLSYGARALNEGGYQSIPKLSFPGGVLIGDGAGFLNVGKIKGIHNAMRSGILAATSAFDALRYEKLNELTTYEKAIKQSPIYDELYKVRNLRPAFHYGLYAGLALSAIDQYIFRGHAPWTLKHHADHLQLRRQSALHKIQYPKPDNKLTFDKPSSVYLSGTFHEENQPCHLVLQDKNKTIKPNLEYYNSPESHYCPAGVYEIINNEQGEKELQINAQNCLHCKTCDIKDPTQNITWKTPEGGGGPNYTDM